VSSGRAAAGQWPPASMGRTAAQRAQAGDGSLKKRWPQTSVSKGRPKIGA
jgi:hypothetical protein